MVVVSPYTPRPLQREIHSRLQRFNVLNCHRRFGKTVFAINEMVKQVLTCEHPNARAAYIAPFRSQAKTIAWEYLQEFTRVIPGMKYNQSELRADFPNGARITLWGADNYNSLRGIYLDFAVIDEVAQIAPSLWSKVVRPALADRKGGCLFIGTPFGMSNQFYELYEAAGERDNWYRATYKADDTKIIDQEELHAARIEMSPEEYEQEFNCSWSAAIRGAFYASELAHLEEQGQIGIVPIDKNYPIITTWDLGIKDSTVVWYLQVVGSQIRVIRCEAFQGMGLQDIIKQVGSHSYDFSQHIAPHDIEVRELGSGQARKALAAKMGVKFDVAPRLSIQDGINALRTMLPRMWFNRDTCQDGIEALKTYRTEYDEKKKVYSNAPLHDWTSDYADSLRYFAITRHKTTMRDDFSLDYTYQNQGIY